MNISCLFPSHVDIKHPFPIDSFPCNAELPWCARKKGCEYPRDALLPVSKLEDDFCCPLLCHYILATVPHPAFTAQPQDTLALQEFVHTNVQPPTQDRRCASHRSSGEPLRSESARLTRSLQKNKSKQQ